MITKHPRSHGGDGPTWMQFVQGKTVESAIEDGEWHVIRFTDGTSFQFTSNDGFLIVEAERQ